MNLTLNTEAALTGQEPAVLTRYNPKLKTSHLLKHLSDGKILSVPKSLSTDNPPVKPEVWFLDNPESKPAVILPTCVSDFSQLATVVKYTLTSYKLQLKYALAYLNMYLRTVKSDPLPENWVSYNVKIGDRASVITPLSLLSVTEGDNVDLAGISTSNLVENEQHALALYILSIYRVLRTPHTAHRKLVVTKITDTMKGFTGSTDPLPYNLEGALNAYSGWLEQPNYLKVVAAFDMFMCKHKGHDLSSMRIGTVSSRFRDCAGLTSINHITNVLSYDACAHIGYWCMTRVIADDFMNLFSGQEELDNQESYFPYQVDLALTDKSAYSASVNPTLYFFVHTIGSLLGSRRSMNAPYFSDKSIQETTILAIWVALIHSDTNTYQRLIGGVDDQPDRNDDDDEEEEGDDDDRNLDRPTELNPRLWFAYLADMNFKFTRSDIKHFRVLQGNMGTEFRENTVGEYISKYRLVDSTNNNLEE